MTTKQELTVDRTPIREAVARGWCQADQTLKTIDPALADAIVAQVAPLVDRLATGLEDMIDAVQWMSGADDFEVGGKAWVGWQKTCERLFAQMALLKFWKGEATDVQKQERDAGGEGRGE